MPVALPLDDRLRQRIKANLQAHDRAVHEDSTLRPAAVAVALVADGDAEACFVITRRALSLRNHGGQWALPGGGLEEGEDARAAALRELREEVGLDRSQRDVLGLLDDYPTRSGFLITPVVVWGGADAILVPNPGEVAVVHRVPIADLDAPGVPRLHRIDESDRPVLSVRVLDGEVFAPTAAVLFQLREVAVHGRGTRVSHYEQPVFAWR